MSSRRRLQGFGLIEAVVALALLGSLGLVLFSWINQSVIETTRIKDAEARAQLQLDAQAWLSTLNPALEPEGKREFGEISVSWTSALVEPMRNEFDLGGALAPRWRVGLYQVKIKAGRAAGQSIEWTQLVAGWQEIGGAPPSERRGP